MTGGTTIGTTAITMSGTAGKIVLTAFTSASSTGAIVNSQEKRAIGGRITFGGAIGIQIPRFSGSRFGNRNVTDGYHQSAESVDSTLGVSSGNRLSNSTGTAGLKQSSEVCQSGFVQEHMACR